jgi:RNA polymerase sigma-70 factor (ECF subfamily)
MRPSPEGVGHDDATPAAPDDAPDDDTLVRRLTTDHDALDAFYRRHVGKVIGFAARRTATPEELADVVAATFVAAIEASPRFDPARGRAVPWLLGIAFNTLMAQRRRELGEARAWARLGGRRLLDADDYDRLEHRIDGERLSPVLSAAVAALPDGERAVLELVTRDDLTPAQAARVLGISGPHARVRLARARRKVRAALRQDDPPSAGPAPRLLPLALKETR